MKRRALLSGVAAAVTSASVGSVVEQQFKFSMLPGFKPPSEVTLVEG